MPAKEARSRKRVEHLILRHEAERSNAATAEIEGTRPAGPPFRGEWLHSCLHCHCYYMFGSAAYPTPENALLLLLLCHSTRMRIPSPTSHLTGPSGGLLCISLSCARLAGTHVPRRDPAAMRRRPASRGRRADRPPRTASGRTGPPARPPGEPAPTHGLRLGRATTADEPMLAAGPICSGRFAAAEQPSARQQPSASPASSPPRASGAPRAACRPDGPPPRPVACAGPPARRPATRCINQQPDGPPTRPVRRMRPARRVGPVRRPDGPPGAPGSPARRPATCTWPTARRPAPGAPGSPARRPATCTWPDGPPGAPGSQARRPAACSWSSSS